MGEKDTGEKDIGIIVEIIKLLQGLLRDGDRLTITDKDARLVRWGSVEALGVSTVVSFLAEER